MDGPAKQSELLRLNEHSAIGRLSVCGHARFGLVFVLALAGCNSLDRREQEDWRALGCDAPARVRLQDSAGLAGSSGDVLAESEAGCADQVDPVGPEGMRPLLRQGLLGPARKVEKPVPRAQYPDLAEDPGVYYHEQFGIGAEHDRFLLPWLTNLIFEDRWLLKDPDPAGAVRDQLSRRMKADISDPGPDIANFPNSPLTLAKGRIYIETSPLGYYQETGARSHPYLYQWEFLFRYGLTDNLEFRIFSNGYTYRSAVGRVASTSGFSPLAFDMKANFWEQSKRYFLPAFGAEVYLQTEFGSRAFSHGTQPSINLLFDQDLPWGFDLEYNLGLVTVQNRSGRILDEFGFQWALQREIWSGFEAFCHGFVNEAALPRFLQFVSQSGASLPIVSVIGVGGLQRINDRLSVFGSYNFGLTTVSPTRVLLAGFAMAF